jgi:predicted membrane protein
MSSLSLFIHIPTLATLAKHSILFLHAYFDMITNSHKSLYLFSKQATMAAAAAAMTIVVAAAAAVATAVAVRVAATAVTDTKRLYLEKIGTCSIKKAYACALKSA